MLSFEDSNSNTQILGPLSWKYYKNEFEEEFLDLTSPSRTPINGINTSDYYSYKISSVDLDDFTIEVNIQDEPRLFL